MARACHWGEPVTEHDLEQACIGWFRELGWSHVPGEAISPGGAHPERKHYTQIILRRRLHDALSRLNPELPAEAHDEAVKRLLQYAGQSLVDANREIYTWLRDGILVEVELDGHRGVRSAQVFDFDDPDNNDWLIVNQFTVKGKMTCRPDLVVFVNGIPLGVIELKNPVDEDTDVTVAFHQIQNYKAEIQQLFEPNLCCVISDGTVARVGSITADEERFMPWRVAEGIEQPEQHLELEVLVRGLFARETLLDYLRYFVAFQNSGSGAAKLIAGYHQYHGVRKAAQRAVEAATQRKDGKGGVMWFTQGSGKSLIALFYVCLLREHPELENPTVVIVTDRNDLDGQMFETFAACPVPLRTEPRQAQEVDDLKDMLRNQPAGGVFFTTIQKFRPDEPGKPMDGLLVPQCRQVIEQDVEAGLEQRLPAFVQKREERPFMRQHLVQATIQRVAGDDPHRAVQQVPQGAVLVPVPVQTPLAARFEQLVAHLRLEHVQPARALPARRQPRSPEPIQLQSIPKRQRQPAPTPLPWPVHAELLDVDPNRLAVQFRGFAIIGKQRHRRRSTIPLQHLDGPAPRRPLAVVDLTQVQHLALNHTPVAVAAVLHHAPVAVLLAVLEASLGAHEHGAIACPNHTPNQGPKSALQPFSQRPHQ